MPTWQHCHVGIHQQYANMEVYTDPRLLFWVPFSPDLVGSVLLQAILLVHVHDLIAVEMVPIVDLMRSTIGTISTAMRSWTWTNKIACNRTEPTRSGENGTQNNSLGWSSANIPVPTGTKPTEQKMRSATWISTSEISQQ